MSAHSSFTSVLKAVPCSLLFSLKTHSALLHGQPSGAEGRGPPELPPPQGGHPHLPAVVPGPLAFLFLFRGLGGTGRGSASEHFIPLCRKPRDAAGLVVSPCPSGLPAAPQGARAPPAGSRPPAAPGRLGLAAPPVPKGHFVKVFGFFLTSFPSLFPEEGPFCTGSDMKASLIFAALSNGVSCF